MPAKNPRISIVVSPTIHALLTELSGMTGQSVSSLVGELLESSEVPLQRTLAMVKAASQAQGELRTGLAASLDKSLDRLQDALDQEMSGFEQLVSGVEKQEKPVRRRSARAQDDAAGARSAPVPPISNKGGKVGSSRGVKGSGRGSKP